MRLQTVNNAIFKQKILANSDYSVDGSFVMAKIFSISQYILMFFNLLHIHT